MLSNFPVYAVILAKDIERAKAFYQEKLGLKPLPLPDNIPVKIARLQAGNGSEISLYEDIEGTMPIPGSTVLGFNVQDLEAVLADLTAKGVEQMTTDLPGPANDKGIVAIGPLKSAWIKDSEGNVITLNEMPTL